MAKLRLVHARHEVYSNRAAGFTLTELLIVVAVIGVLAAISVPNYAKARERAQKSACINNLRQIDWAKQQWALENRGSGGVVPTKAQIAVYLGRQRTVETIVCPVGGPTATFDTSYLINSITNVPTCQIDPMNHFIQ